MDELDIDIDITDSNTESETLIVDSVEDSLLQSILEDLNQNLPEVQYNEESSETGLRLPLNPMDGRYNEITSRFNSAEWFDKIGKKSIHLIGLGGIGSWTALLLASANPYRIILQDDDIVETGNMSGQLFSSNDRGHKKVHGVERILDEFRSYNNIDIIMERFTRISPVFSDIVITGLDNMTARNEIYHSWKARISGLSSEEKKEALFIDGRLAAEEFQIIAIPGMNLARQREYEETWLFGEGEAESTICSFKQTSHIAAIIGGIIVNILTNFIANQVAPLVPRAVPFLTTYKAPLMQFEVR